MKFLKEEYGFISDCKTIYFDNIKNKYVQFKWYTCWLNMINRCYNKNNPNYNNYGGKGIFVDNSFKKLSDFRDFYLENNPNGDLEMDKDMLKKGYYGKDSVVFISKSKNVSESTLRNISIHSERLKKNIGDKHPRAKSKEYYSNNSTTKSNFKKICLTQGWNYNSFTPINSGSIAKDRHILYFFIENNKGDLYECN